MNADGSRPQNAACQPQTKIMNTPSAKPPRRFNRTRPVRLLAALAVLILQSAQAALYLTDSFSYSAGALGVSPANGTWDTTTKSAINVTVPKPHRAGGISRRKRK